MSADYEFIKAIIDDPKVEFNFSTEDIIISYMYTPNKKFKILRGSFFGQEEVPRSILLITPEGNAQMTHPIDTMPNREAAMIQLLDLIASEIAKIDGYMAP